MTGQTNKADGFDKQTDYASSRIHSKKVRKVHSFSVNLHRRKRISFVKSPIKQQPFAHFAFVEPILVPSQVATDDRAEHLSPELLALER